MDVATINGIFIKKGRTFLKMNQCGDSINNVNEEGKKKKDLYVKCKYIYFGGAIK